MNKENIKKVIKAIEFDGKNRFNMSTFVGKIDRYELSEDDYVYDKPTHILHIEDLTTTDLFNCNSVGCIAGFATAVANDWQNPFLNLPEDQKDEHISYYFEELANEFLGLTKAEGKNLYYGDEYSVWKYLLWNKDPRFSNLRLEENSEFDEYDEYYESSCELDLRSITPENAITLLKMLIDEEIVLDHGYTEGPIFVKELTKTNSEEE